MYQSQLVQNCVVRSACLIFSVNGLIGKGYVPILNDLKV